MDIKMLHPSRVFSAIEKHGKREFSLLLGAGASISSGVPSAGEMIREWRRELYVQEHPGGDASDAVIETWAKTQPWRTDPDFEYSSLFEEVYRTESARQGYIASKVEGAFPSWGYLYLANLMMAGCFNITYTTNFDDLINDALTIFLGHNPVVSAADSQIEQISPVSDRVKIVKLHGDYLFKRLKNTRSDLEHLDPTMDRKFREFSKHRGLIVLGYSGRDLSVMRVLGELLNDTREDFFPTGIYWGTRTEPVDGHLKQLATAHPQRLFLFHCNDFDEFVADLHARLRLELPDSIRFPYRSLRAKLVSLVTSLPGRITNTTIAEHRAHLQKQLAELPLLEAQMLLAKRQYHAAIEVISECVHERGDDPLALTIWGAAHVVEAEETGNFQIMDRAAALWRRAVQADPISLPPRRNLITYCVMRNLTSEAIEHAEVILQQAPNDTIIRLGLGQLYLRVHRHLEALGQADWLLQRYPNDPQFNAFRAEILAATGRLWEAISQAQRAISLEPNNSWFRIGLARMLLSAGRPVEAEQECRRALHLEPTNSVGLSMMCMLLRMTGRFPELAQTLDQLRRISPALAASIEQTFAMQPGFPPSHPPQGIGYPPQFAVGGMGSPPTPGTPQPSSENIFNKWWRALGNS